MRILHYVNNLGSGGAEKLLTDILPLMKQKGHDVALVIANDKGNVNKYEQILINAAVPITNFSVNRYNPFQILRLIRIVRKGKYDIVHGHLFPTQYWLAIASLFFPKRTRLVKTEHNTVNKRMKRKALRPVEQFIYSRFSAIIAISDTVKQNLVQWLGVDRNVAVIYNGVNLKQIIQEQQSVRLSKYEFLKRDAYNMLMVGRFDGFAKDQKTLIDAISQLPPKFVLFFAGEGVFMETMREYAAQKGVADRVHFLGMRTDVYRLMHLVDLNILSTNFEGVSGVVLESLASKRPFIGSDVPGVREIVPGPRHLFPKGDVKAVVQKILELSSNEDLTREMIDDASAFVMQFPTEKMVENYLDLYKSIQ